MAVNPAFHNITHNPQPANLPPVYTLPVERNQLEATRAIDEVIGGARNVGADAQTYANRLHVGQSAGFYKDRVNPYTGQPDVGSGLKRQQADRDRMVGVPQNTLIANFNNAISMPGVDRAQLFARLAYHGVGLNEDRNRARMNLQDATTALPETGRSLSESRVQLQTARLATTLMGRDPKNGKLAGAVQQRFQAAVDQMRNGNPKGANQMVAEEERRARGVDVAHRAAINRATMAGVAHNLAQHTHAAATRENEGMARTTNFLEDLCSTWMDDYEQSVARAQVMLSQCDLIMSSDQWNLGEQPNDPAFEQQLYDNLEEFNHLLTNEIGVNSSVAPELIEQAITTRYRLEQRLILLGQGNSRFATVTLPNGQAMYGGIDIGNGDIIFDDGSRMVNDRRVMGDNQPWQPTPAGELNLTRYAEVHSNDLGPIMLELQDDWEQTRTPESSHALLEASCEYGLRLNHDMHQLDNWLVQQRAHVASLEAQANATGDPAIAHQAQQARNILTPQEHRYLAMREERNRTHYLQGLLEATSNINHISLANGHAEVTPDPAAIDPAGNVWIRDTLNVTPIGQVEHHNVRGSWGIEPDGSLELIITAPYTAHHFFRPNGTES